MQDQLSQWSGTVSSKDDILLQKHLQGKQVLLGQKEATARMRGGLRRAGPNDFMFMYNLMERDLSISIIFVLLVMFSIFRNLSTIHNLTTYIL